ncbi:MAG TPA: Vms1/Ankzf1 family peptidyl-tRNA hydrolase [Ilumatobacteraceae bacterium]|nr:Vms1/Ankzf1 family peptidyl-tRNA hydrolase [Ilumatobacteraceae bacterium]
MSRTTELHDVRQFIDGAAPFLTVAMPTPSQLDDARHRFETRWKNARRELEASRWTADDLAALDAVMSELPHDGGAALVLFCAADGTTFAEFLDEPVHEFVVAESALPRLSLVIEARQRAVGHLVVETDRAGADIHAFDGGRVLGTEQVEGDTEYIHRGHPGGWSQRRFQQRAENTWERNADDVASQVVEMAGAHAVDMIFVAGDTRAQHLVLESLPERERAMTTLVEAGSPDGVADEIVRLLSDHVARDVVELIGQVASRRGAGTASTDVADILAGLDEGRVEHLLVHDDVADEAVTSQPVGGVPAGARIVDAAIAAALRTDAHITVIPGVALLEGSIAALYRW